MGLFGLFGPPDVEKMKAKKNVKGLIKALDYQKDWHVREAAAEALGQIGAPRAGSTLGWFDFDTGKRRKMRKQLFIAVLMFGVCALLIACGPSEAEREAQTPTLVPPTHLTDEEFTEAARQVCSALKTDIDPDDTFTTKAKGYRRAADRLSELEITKESAPQGFLLRSSLVELATLYDALDKAIAEALTGANIEGSFSLIITEDGTVMASPGNERNLFEKMANMKQLDIETDLVLNLLETEGIIRETAVSLGLGDCAVQ